jgi:hypothetical protein
MTSAVKRMDSQRWVCRVKVFQFIAISFPSKPVLAV